VQELTLRDRVARAEWYRWPVGSAVRTTGCADLLRVVGHTQVQRRGAHLRLRVAVSRGEVQLTMAAAVCVPALDDHATAALLLAQLWEQDTAWHTHTHPGACDQYVAHIDPELGEWCAGTLGEALALAALHCLPGGHP